MEQYVKHSLLWGNMGVGGMCVMWVPEWILLEAQHPDYTVNNVVYQLIISVSVRNGALF